MKHKILLLIFTALLVGCHSSVIGGNFGAANGGGSIRLGTGLSF